MKPRKFRLKKDLPWIPKWTIIISDTSYYRFTNGIDVHPDYQNILYRCFFYSKDYTNEYGEELDYDDTPTMLSPENIDRSLVRDNAQSIVDEIVEWKYHEDNDNAHYLYEATMTALYWKGFRDWFNKNT